ncbi:MAG: TrkA family potassium uptake protein [Erysipelotrichaceae bacterium]|nr:TrkA family potassium uptake protein [Erysipelotrichaceae bacterium]
MRIMIIGGGNVGYYLTKDLMENKKNHIMLVEEDKERCDGIENDLGTHNVAVTWGDGTDAQLLKDAGIGETDVVITVTGHDQNNLTACQIAKDYFGVKRTVARVKNPKNIIAFKKLGVDSVISSTDAIANTINEELDWTEMKRFVEDHTSDLKLSRYTVAQGAGFEGHTLREISLKSGVIIIAILRDGSVIVPNGETILMKNDEVILWGKKEELDKIRTDGSFSGGAE